MRLSPTEIYNGRNVFIIGATGFVGKVALSMLLDRFPGVGRVIAAGAENAHVPAMMGWERADNLTEAIAMARSYMGRSAEITMLHQPVIALCEVE